MTDKSCKWAVRMADNDLPVVIADDWEVEGGLLSFYQLSPTRKRIPVGVFIGWKYFVRLDLLREERIA